MADNVLTGSQVVTIDPGVKTLVPCAVAFEKHDRPHADELQYGTVYVRAYLGDCLSKIFVGTSRPSITNVSSGSRGGYGYYLNFHDYGVRVFATKGKFDIADGSPVYSADGTLTGSGSAFQNVTMTEDIEFIGGKSGRVRYPVKDNVDIAVHWYSKVCPDTTGSSSDVYAGHVGFQYDSFTGQIFASEECFGLVTVTYVTQYVLLTYSPDIYMDYEVYSYPDPKKYGKLVATVPMVNLMQFGYNDTTWREVGATSAPGQSDLPSVISWAVQPPQPQNIEFELYKVTSVALAGPDGLAELLPNFPTETIFPEGLDDDSKKKQFDVSNWVDSSMQIERVHEIGFLRIVDHDERGNVSGNNPQTSQYADQSEALIANTKNSQWDEPKIGHYLKVIGQNVPYAYPYEKYYPTAVLSHFSTDNMIDRAIAVGGAESSGPVELLFRIKISVKLNKPPIVDIDDFTDRIGVVTKAQTQATTKEQQQKVINGIIRSMYISTDRTALVAAIKRRFNARVYDIEFVNPDDWVHGMDKTGSYFNLKP